MKNLAKTVIDSITEDGALNSDDVESVLSQNFLPLTPEQVAEKVMKKTFKEHSKVLTQQQDEYVKSHIVYRQSIHKKGGEHIINYNKVHQCHKSFRTKLWQLAQMTLLSLDWTNFSAEVMGEIEDHIRGLISGYIDDLSPE